MACGWRRNPDLDVRLGLRTKSRPEIYLPGIGSRPFLTQIREALLWAIIGHPALVAANQD
jgi:hypothetical protein